MDESTSIDPTESTIDVDAVAKMIDDVILAFRRGIYGAAEATGLIIETATGFVRAHLDVDEVDLILSYGRTAVEEIADGRGVMDPLLVEHYDDQVAGVHVEAELRARLEMLLDSLEIAARRGDADAMAEIAAICRTGCQTHRQALRLDTAAVQVLEVAHRLRHAEALRDAISPVHAYDGQIAHFDRHPRSFRLALNLLAHLAADPDRGGSARSALLELVGFVETAGEAAIRLPIHLLDDSDRCRLLEIHEARVELLTRDPVYTPLGLGLLRDNRVVRGSLWQAYDARHIC